MSFNKIILVGNLGKDPELRYTPQGVAVCDFSMATNERRKTNGGEREEIATWFKVTLWQQRAEAAAKYLTKGSPIYIEGKLSVSEWTDRDNKSRYGLEVQATDMKFIAQNGLHNAGNAIVSDDDPSLVQDFYKAENSRDQKKKQGFAMSGGDPSDSDILF